MKKRLTKLQKRMLVLKDALKQIKIGFLKPENSGLCTLPESLDDEDESQAQPLLKRLQQIGKKCKVCARGSLLLATVGRFNSYTISDLAYSGGAFNSDSVEDRRLMRLFSANQLMMMETAFEGEHNEMGLNNGDFRASRDFFYRYKTPKRRLIAILENAVKNKGTFIP